MHLTYINNQEVLNIEIVKQLSFKKKIHSTCVSSQKILKAKIKM